MYSKLCGGEDACLTCPVLGLDQKTRQDLERRVDVALHHNTGYGVGELEAGNGKHLATDALESMAKYGQETEADVRDVLGNIASGACKSYVPVWIRGRI